jgi:HSP20 family protein
MHPLQATFRRGFSRPLDELRDELDRLWVPLTSAPPLHGWGVMDQGSRFPAVNLSEHGDAFLVEAELPGLGADQVDVSVNGEELVIRGSRPEISVGSDKNDGGSDQMVWHRRERGAGSFERRLSLPAAIDAEHVEARLVDGVLRVTCPKAAEARPRKITVQAS